MARAKSQPRPDTPEAILDAAERLFGMHGLEGVSLRQIGAAAGSSNSYVIQYHFGDKQGLLRAIFERRLPALEVKRARMLASANAEGKAGDPRTLLEIIVLPIASELDLEGRCSYAAFILSLLIEDVFQSRQDADHLAPITSHVTNLMRAALPHIPLDAFGERVRAAWIVFLSAAVRWDRRRMRGEKVWPKEAMIRDALDLALAAMTASVSPEVAALE